jgi:peptide/nickel transport system substrate-binding protein
MNYLNNRTEENMIIRKIKKFIWLLNVLLIFNGVCLFAQSEELKSLFYSVPYFETRTLNPVHGSYYIEGVQANELMYSRLWTWKKDISETSDLVADINSKSIRAMLRTPMKGSSLFSYKVQIRDDLKWPDGEPLSTEDIKFSFDLYRNEKTKSVLRDLLDVFKKIEIIDNRTIQFFIEGQDKHRAQYILPLVQILPQHKVITNYLSKKSEFSNEPMGSGPFQFLPMGQRGFADKGNDKIVFKKNEYYYRWDEENSNIGSVKVSEEKVVGTVITKLINPNRAEDWSTLDMVLNVPNARTIFPNLKDQGKDHLTFNPYKSNSWYGIAFNCEKPFLKNRNVRLALSHAVNIDKHINDYYTTVKIASADEPIAHRISGPFNPLWGTGDASIKPLIYDVSKAKELLKSNNVDEKNNKRYYKDEEVQLKFIYNSGKVLIGSPEELIIKRLIENIKNLGIKVKSVSLGAKAFSKKLNEGDYDLAFQYYEIGYGGNISQLFTEGDLLNISRFSDPSLTNFMNKFNRSRGKVKREHGKRIHQIIHKEAPYIFLYRLDKIMAYRDEELETNNQIVPKYFFTHIGEWYFKN